MYYVFDKNKYNAFFTMLVDFAGNDNSVESYYRNIFKDNVARILASVAQTDLEDTDVDKLNTIIQDILDYKILLTDVYYIVGNIFYRIKDFIDIFYNYSSSTTEDLDKIYTTEFDVGTEKSSILDMFFTNVKNMELLNNNVYIIPNIEYKYIASPDSFKNELEAFTSFYSNANILNAVTGKSFTFTNIELNSLKNNFLTAYNNRMLPLYLVDTQKLYEPILVFFKNLHVDVANSRENLHIMYRDNSHLFNMNSILDLLQTNLHKLYYAEISNFDFRDLIFDPKNYIYNLHPKNCADITTDTFAYNLMLAIISPVNADKDNLVSYINELKNFKLYLDAIYTVATGQFGNKIKIGG